MSKACCGPVEGMRRLAQHTFRLLRAHCEIVALMNAENLHRTRHLRATEGIPKLHDPLLHAIEGLLEKRHAQGPAWTPRRSTSPYPAVATFMAPIAGPCPPHSPVTSSRQSG